MFHKNWMMVINQSECMSRKFYKLEVVTLGYHSVRVSENMQTWTGHWGRVQMVMRRRSGLEASH